MDPSPDISLFLQLLVYPYSCTNRSPLYARHHSFSRTSTTLRYHETKSYRFTVVSIPRRRACRTIGGRGCEQGDTKDPCFVRMPSKRAKISRMSFHHILDFLLNPCSLASRGSRRKPERAVSFKLNWFRYVDLSSNPRLHSRNLPNSKLNLNLAGCAEMWAAGCELVFGLSGQSEKIILE